LGIWEEEVFLRSKLILTKMEIGMRGFLINKNLCLYYWLKKRIGKESAYRVASVFEKIILSFGRGTYEGNKT
jgi:hypothetical protein